MPSSPTRLTRPQRRRAWGICCGLCWLWAMLPLWLVNTDRLDRAMLPASDLPAVTRTTEAVTLGMFTWVSWDRVTEFDAAGLILHQALDVRPRPLGLAATIALTALGSWGAVRWWRHLVESRRLEGRCDECGYDRPDLAGGLSARPCPECGAIPRPLGPAAGARD